MQQILFLVKNAMSYRIIYELRESTGLINPKGPKQAMKIQNYSLQLLHVP